MNSNLAEKIRVAAFDLDGTLILSGQPIHPPVEKAIRELYQKGVVCSICSGRNASQILPPIREPFQYLIAANGAHVKNLETGEDIVAVIIPPEILLQIAKLTKKHRAVAYLYQGEVMSSFFDTHLFALREATRRAKKSMKGCHFIKAFKENWQHFLDGMLLGNQYQWNFISYAKRPKTPTLKAYLFMDNATDKESLAVDLEQLGTLEVLRMESLTLEVTMKGVTKAWGLSKLAEHLGYTIENCVAFGDSTNDIEVLEAAGCGVAMGNAGDHVKPHADFVTKTFEEDGVAAFINQYLL